MHSTNDSNNNLKKYAATASISLSLLLSILKIFAAIYTGSLAILSSLIDSLADVFASLVTFIAIKISSKPADLEHRYGFGKAEAISTLVQAAFIAGSGIFVMYDAINRLFYPIDINHPIIGISIMVISLFLTLLLIYFQKYVTKKTHSQAIYADSIHYTTDLITNLSIIITLIIVKYLHLNWFDTITAFLVSVYLLTNAYKLATKALNILMDKELDSNIRKQISKTVLSCPFVKGMHDLRTHDIGGTYIIELHLELDGNLSLHTAHNFCDIVTDEIQKIYPNSQIIIHQDPAGLKEDRLDAKLHK